MAIRRWEGWHPADLSGRFWNTISKNYHLGFTSFGGPPVHFKIFHDKFVRKLQWIDEQVYQGLFSVCQAFSGPGSTKMHYCINLIHDGFLPAALGFFIWSLPGALGMYGLSGGVSNIGTSLPRPVYALLSGLNASTVGIIALAAVQLSEKAITDKMTRILVFLGAAAGMLYNALWYFPLLMFLAGIVAIVHDFRWLHGPVKAVVNTLRNPGKRRRHQTKKTSNCRLSRKPATRTPLPDERTRRRDSRPTLPLTECGPPSAEGEPRVVPPERNLNFSWEFGLGLIVFFLITFVVIMVLRGVLQIKSLLFSFFANMYLAGTIIFGGGPVVIPLLREYVVGENWVSPRDFLIGLAIQQSFPGPNFNFAVYLGALTAINGGYNSATGAALGFVGIYAPGLITVHGTIGIWSAIRGLRWVKSLLRGVNAAAVGLIYTAVYRLWQIGYIDEGFQQRTSLGLEPWWVVVTATSYVGGYWLGVSPPVAIVMSAVFGLIWYAVVSG
ncbi:chromate transporter-domain-containing protein [Ilyonectria robusta]|uniref:chromate transporter-domain-containing protein n=1 Tax=Ilyonectria robusta TaxID=1079257 RepID=UPI001E8CE3D7|nr:chromate transporter-domain-containing protein [Ilyonectria robusta]KAH8661178.1 chromate transporter-domain-containing protein [Ilyonectria robusta]